MAVWQPELQVVKGGGLVTNAFGFTVAWASGMAVVIEATTNLTSPDWSPLQTNVLVSDSWYFSDPAWINDPRRFYRARWP